MSLLGDLHSGLLCRKLGNVRQEATELIRSYGIQPKLVLITASKDHHAIESYIRKKQSACECVGFASEVVRLPIDITHNSMVDVLRRYGKDASVHGILVQLPLPKHLDPIDIAQHIDPRKDVDGLHSHNMGRIVLGIPYLFPCTPAGVVALLSRSGMPTQGKHAVVVGRSLLVGKPLANILLLKQYPHSYLHGNHQSSASQLPHPGFGLSVTIVHSQTPNLETYTRQADFLVVAAGSPHLIGPKAVKPDCTAVVIDVGINHLPDPSKKSGFRIVGDIDPAVQPYTAAYTPVPGGVGPMTVAMLMRNTLEAVKFQIHQKGS